MVSREKNRISVKILLTILSLNPHFWGDISAWFYRYILGININPTLKDKVDFEISPVYLTGVDDATRSYIRNGKGISIKRHQENGLIYIKIESFGGATYKIVNYHNLIVEN